MFTEEQKLEVAKEIFWAAFQMYPNESSGPRMTLERVWKLTSQAHRDLAMAQATNAIKKFEELTGATTSPD